MGKDYSLCPRRLLGVGTPLHTVAMSRNVSMNISYDMM